MAVTPGPASWLTLVMRCIHLKVERHACLLHLLRGVPLSDKAQDLGSGLTTVDILVTPGPPVSPLPRLISRRALSVVDMHVSLL